jgi:hypothetical protein
VAAILSIGAGLLEHPSPELDDESRLLGKRDGRRRRYRSSSWVVPTHQGLEAHDLPIMGPHDRLILNPQLSSFLSLAQCNSQIHVAVGKVM